MENFPLISVITPTYNRADYVTQAIDSILNQTYTNIELHVIDDGSTDNTPEVMARYDSDPRVHYYRQPNAGQGAATNRGISLARGEYIAFLDADDLWIPEKLELQVKAMQEKSDIAILYSPCYCIDEKNQVIGARMGPLYEGHVTGRLFVENFIPFGSALVKKECFERLGAFDESLVTGLDYELWLRFSTCYLFGYIDIPTLHYRLWGGQITVNGIRVYENGIKIMRKFLRLFPGMVDRATENEAWAHTYVAYGDFIRSGDQKGRSALNYYIRALRHKPGYLAAWKAIIATILRMR